MLQKLKTTLLLAAILITACGNTTQAKDAPPWITIEGRTELDESVWSAAIEAAVTWDEVYDCNRDIIIRPFTTQTRDLTNGYTEQVLEQAGPGYIEVGNQGNTYYIVAHAMTHACAGNVVTLTTPIPFTDGTIIGFEGLSIRVHLITGDNSIFTKIEEAVAERNASCAVPDYTVSDPRYFSLGKQARNDFPCGNDQVNVYLKNSDMVGLVADYFNIEPNSVTVEDVEFLMSIYQQAWQAGSP